MGCGPLSLTVANEDFIWEGGQPTNVYKAYFAQSSLKTILQMHILTDYEYNIEIYMYTQTRGTFAYFCSEMLMYGIFCDPYVCFQVIPTPRKKRW